MKRRQTYADTSDPDPKFGMHKLKSGTSAAESLPNRAHPRQRGSMVKGLCVLRDTQGKKKRALGAVFRCPRARLAFSTGAA